MTGALRGVVRGLQWMLPRSRSGLRILCYHLVEGGTDSVVDLPRADFERQLDAVAGLSEPTALQAAVERLDAFTDDSPARTAVTFDDAYRNFAEVAWPLLLERRIPVTLFVPTGFVDGRCPPPLSGHEGLEPLPWRELRAMLATGLLTVGAHTDTHPDLRALDDERLAAELQEPRRELEDRLGVAVEAFCYPRGLWNARVEAAVKRTYGLAVVGGGRRVRPGRVDRYRLPRTSVRREPALPVESWLQQPVWLEEAAADLVRRWR